MIWCRHDRGPDVDVCSAVWPPWCPESGDARGEGDSARAWRGLMIVALRTGEQAAKVAVLTGGVQLPGEPKPDGTAALSRYVAVGADFEVHRQGVESVSVLFGLYGGDVDSYAATGSPGAKLPTGWMVTAAKFEVDWAGRGGSGRVGAVAFRGAPVRVQLGFGAGESRSGRAQVRSGA